MKTREELITGIRNILTALGVTEFRWADACPEWSPILQEGNNSDNTFGTDFVDYDGVDGSSCWDTGRWCWDELPTETIEEIYNVMSEYENKE